MLLEDPKIPRVCLRNALWSLAALWASAATAAQPLTLWHSNEGAQAKGLEQAAAAFTAKTGQAVEVRAVAQDSIASVGPGPDVLVLSRERLMQLQQNALLTQVDAHLDAKAYLPAALEALRVEGHLYGYPLTVEALALYRNLRLAPLAPDNTDGLEVLLRTLKDPAQGRYGLAWVDTDFHVHHAILAGFGGGLLDVEGTVQLDTPALAASLTWVKRLQAQGLAARLSTPAQVVALFNAQKAAFVIAGPSFAAQLDPEVPFALSPLPVVTATGKPMQPSLGVEAAAVWAASTQREAAFKLAEFLSRGEGASVRARVGQQLPADLDSRSAVSPALEGFRRAVAGAALLPSSPQLSRMWEPMGTVLREVLEGSLSPDEAGARGQRLLIESDPARAPPRRWAAAVAAALVVMLTFVWWRRRRPSAG